ncbi:uncharacterized protein MELLADRAFT_111126 [Melampsora larici-populina 98AG31]|uniref:Uncharacterized protein n=1 Tax=Melampsora larici-populina (strain 98AG31 / pathotype 3-4-7) TaxID=747676 RepID=F4S242_MELLP|nr:uncharacterized protein MELLADRAFT_111126 [Melampsora larici-populina 98AG31]EGG01297.1 hypothetical protein MELLADRAFT_111126 [Melampsora larici-populina 98AG31]
MVISNTQPSTPSIQSPPHYHEISNLNSFNPSSNSYFPILPSSSSPPPPPPPPPLIRRFTSPDLLPTLKHSLIKPHQQFTSFVSRFSSVLKKPTLPLLNPPTHRPKKLQKPRPKNHPHPSNKHKNLNYQPITLQPWFNDSDSDSDFDNDEEDDLNVKAVESKSPIRTIVKRTPVHFFTGDSTVIEIQTFWSDGTQIISKPQIGSHSILRRPEYWMGWPSRRQS